MNLNYTLGLVFLIILLLLFLAGQDESQASCNCPPGWSSGLERICGPKKCFCGGKGKYPGCAPVTDAQETSSAGKRNRQPGCGPLVVEETLANSAKAAHGAGDQGRGRCRILPDEAAVDELNQISPSSKEPGDSSGSACDTCNLTPLGEHCSDCQPTLEEWETRLTASVDNHEHIAEKAFGQTSPGTEADWQEEQFEEEVKCGPGGPIAPPSSEDHERVQAPKEGSETLALAKRQLAGIVALKKLWK